MRTFNLPTTLGACLALAACNPETDLQGQRTTAAGTEGGDGQPSGSAGNSESGQLLEPPSGTSDIATNLANVILRLPEAIVASDAGGTVMLQPSGSAGPVPLQLGAQVPCGGTCYAFAVTAELSPSVVYAVKIPTQALQFADGKPVPPGDAGGFTTGAGPDLFAPRIQAFTLQIAEGCAAVHVAADEPVSAQVIISSGGVDTTLGLATVGLAMDFSERLPDLAADPRAQAAARVVDRSGNQAVSEPLSFALPPPVAPVVITEVLANPVGSENTQEFVEIYNRGSAAVDLGGWSLEDETGKDALPAATLPAGTYALIVSDTYNPADGKDPAPVEGTLLVHVPGRLGSDGMSNAGEAIRLVDAEGQVVSQYGGWVDASATSWSGKSTKRLSPEACDSADAWSRTPSSPTPGW